MTERPILFSGEMVRALLAGTKTQTRRVVKLAGGLDFIGGAGQQADPACWGFGDIDGCWHVLDQGAMPWQGSGISGESYAITCPYGAPGDLLWVRETHALVPRTAYAQSEGVQQTTSPTDPDQAAVYREGWERAGPGKWRPSIHMQRWASRITLRVTSVRVERVQDISDEDARAEGVKPFGRSQRAVYGMTLENVGPVYPAPAADIIAGGESWTTSAARSFRGLWVSINGAESWAANPWCWCVGFERVEAAHG